ncbi:single-stranded DNA-binding protein [Calidithermus chliarophilus]|uniref:single-stranded DNA-binding protein n=1 Tax=Calidithermus chliarophilus TaxID=52023 RepID=UPI0004046A0B|nr:single-stranded DNA-binding protein [Calidithermus chliarophilus]
MNLFVASGCAKVELRYTPQGTPILELTLAGRRSAGGRELFSLVRGKVLGKRAEALSEALRDGDALYCAGALEYRSWEQDGQKRSRVDAVFSEVYRLEAPRVAEGQYGPLLEGCVNRAFLIGNLARDPEARHTPQGNAVTRAALAVNVYNSARKESVGHFFELEAWHEVAARLAEARKGQPLQVAGALKTDSWEQDGQKRYVTRLEVDALTPLHGVGARGQGQGQPREKKPAPDIDEGLEDEGFPPEEDLPF